ncbi:unnamed protein product [Rotaria socialis]|uniref:PWWP domain-containing protein n=2 Tax=Rotaria socialis TaxID=392032 RepID=A0A818Z5P4_9BILA|nr:unnamed protein product [Rotaria socialis]
MTTAQSSSESIPKKRQRRVKQDPEFIFENATTHEIEINVKPKPTKQNFNATPTKSIDSIDDSSIGADLYEPGDIVWSKLGSFPWWPALIYRCDAENGIFTRTFNSYNKTKRQFFVYFYGKYLEYSWLSTRSLLKYAGLNTFIQNAETAVQQASTKSEKLELANRYQLKVSMKKRAQWDEAIELADRALTMTKDERIKQFSVLLNESQIQKKQLNTNFPLLDSRRGKAFMDKSLDTETISNKRRKRSSASPSFHLPDEIEKPSQISNQSDHDKKEDEPPVKKKRGRKPKSSLKTNEKDNHTSTLTPSDNKNANYSIRSRSNKSMSPPNKKTIPSLIIQRKKLGDNTEMEYEYLPPSKHEQTASPFIHANIPLLSNYEQKQIVEGLLNYANEKSLTLEEARIFAVNKATEIVYENYNYRMDNISAEWFYDSILLKYPSVVFKYRSWFEQVKSDVIPDGTDAIELKKWQIALMIEAQTKAEQNQLASNEMNSI